MCMIKILSSMRYSFIVRTVFLIAYVLIIEFYGSMYFKYREKSL